MTRFDDTWVCPRRVVASGGPVLICGKFELPPGLETTWSCLEETFCIVEGNAAPRIYLRDSLLKHSAIAPHLGRNLEGAP